MCTTKITPGRKDGKGLRRVARRMLGWVGIHIPLYPRCRLGNVVRLDRRLHARVPCGAELN